MLSELGLARTGLQECDGCIQLIPILPLALRDHRVVQHGAAVLSSATEVSGYGECGLCTSMKCMHHSKRAHRVLVVDGNQAHLEQGLGARQSTPVRIPHSDGDCELEWATSVVSAAGPALSGSTGGFLRCTESESERRAQNSCSDDLQSRTYRTVADSGKIRMSMDERSKELSGFTC